MNIKDALLKEHSKTQRDLIASYIGNNPNRFAELMQLFFKGDTIIPQRASWSMSECVEKYPALITPFLKPLIHNLQNKELHDGVIRNSLRILQFIPIPKNLQGTLMNTCFQFIESNHTAVAIKAFSLTILHHLSREYPEIIPELKLVILDKLEHETVAFASRAKKILKDWKD